jgi:hypothetical protein
LVFFQVLFPRIIQQHREVNELGGEIVDKRSVLFPPDCSDFEVSEGLIRIKKFAR